jgi:hypothetical protein
MLRPELFAHPRLQVLWAGYGIPDDPLLAELGLLASAPIVPEN